MQVKARRGVPGASAGKITVNSGFEEVRSIMFEKTSCQEFVRQCPNELLTIGI